MRDPLTGSSLGMMILIGSSALLLFYRDGQITQFVGSHFGLAIRQNDDKATEHCNRGRGGVCCGRAVPD